MDDLRARESELKAWAKTAHEDGSLFTIPDAWVNFRRWTLRYDPLDALRSFARAAREAKTIALTGTESTRMLKRLPRGNQLPGWAKQDLRAFVRVRQAQGCRQVARSAARSALRRRAHYDQDDPARHVIANDDELSGWLDKHIGKRDPANPRTPRRRRK